MKTYAVYDVRLTSETKYYNGLAYIIDGERGQRMFPGTWAKNYCIALYKYGISPEKDYFTRSRLLAEFSGKKEV